MASSGNEDGISELKSISGEVLDSKLSPIYGIIREWRWNQWSEEYYRRGVRLQAFADQWHHQGMKMDAYSSLELISGESLEDWLTVANLASLDTSEFYTMLLKDNIRCLIIIAVFIPSYHCHIIHKHKFGSRLLVQEETPFFRLLLTLGLSHG